MADTDITKKQEHTTEPPKPKVVTIPGVQLKVSLGKDVVVRIPDVDQSYRGKIVGYSPFDYLIASVRLPSSTRRQVIRDGQVIIKYIHQGTVYGFKTYVHNAITSPTSLIFFDYPSVIEKFELRRDTRTECNMDATLQIGTAEHECLVVNLSSTGCKISARAGTRAPISAIEVDDTMAVLINPGSVGILKLPIAIRNVARKQGFLTLGTMFLDLNNKEEERIHNYIERKRRLTR